MLEFANWHMLSWEIIPASFRTSPFHTETLPSKKSMFIAPDSSVFEFLCVNAFMVLPSSWMSMPGCVHFQNGLFQKLCAESHARCLSGHQGEGGESLAFADYSPVVKMGQINNDLV